MKPYLKAAYNEIRFQWLKMVHCSGMQKDGLILLGFNTRITAAKSARIHLGRHVISDGRLSVIAGENATVSIGDGTYFNEGCMVSSKSSVTIGKGCQFGPNVMIFDNNHRFTRAEGVLSTHTAAPIVIGDHSWIGSNVVILKGSRVGSNCVIGAGCVISGDVPDGSLVTQGRELQICPIRERV